MGDANDQHDEFIAPDFVQDAMVSDAQPPQPTHVALQRRAEMGGLRQSVDGRDDPCPL